ncbi:hypothetical protein [Chryseobacterium sp. A301]
MTLLRLFGFSAALLFLLVSCTQDINQQKIELEKREAALQEKESAFALKQADYQLLSQMRDSIVSSVDSLDIHPKLDLIAGKWKGKIVCTESSCPEYVVGDTRIDDWQLEVVAGIVTAKNLNKSGFIRVYKGTIENNQLKLYYNSPADATTVLNIGIVFPDLSANKLSGSRNVQIDGKCQSKYTIELSR